jgi:excisionase family DNA binding protein
MNQETISAGSRIESRLLRPLDLAKTLNVCERTVREWQSKGVIPFVKVGRVVLFDIEKVMSALERYERKAAA